MSLLLALLLGTVPGALNPAVTQDTLATTICATGYTATVRPSRSWAYRYKIKLMAQQHLTSRHILDHKVPLELGGAPKDPANLQLQTVKAAKAKDADERRGHALVCSGRWTLAQGQAFFMRWGQ